MIQHRNALIARTVMAAATACVFALACSEWFAAHAQAPTGHQQPKAGDVPQDSPRKATPRSPEDIALERALNNICRGCSPIIPVRDVPRYDVARSCPDGSGQGGERCRTEEETARTKLKEQWTDFTEKARSDCVQTAEIGGRPSYIQLMICLKAAQIAPTLRDGR